MSRVAYLPAMRSPRFFSILAMLALLFAPVGMLGSHAAMAMPHHSSAEAMNHGNMHHEPPEDDQSGSMIDCTIACSAMPSREPYQAPPGSVAPPEYRRAAVPDVEGTRPEAMTPPPRIS